MATRGGRSLEIEAEALELREAELQRKAQYIPHVLYVEDDQISREVITLFLKGEFDIDLAVDSSEAILKIKKNTIPQNCEYFLNIS